VYNDCHVICVLVTIRVICIRVWSDERRDRRRQLDEQKEGNRQKAKENNGERWEVLWQKNELWLFCVKWQVTGNNVAAQMVPSNYCSGGKKHGQRRHHSGKSVVTTETMRTTLDSSAGKSKSYCKVITLACSGRVFLPIISDKNERIQSIQTWQKETINVGKEIHRKFGGDRVRGAPRRFRRCKIAQYGPNELLNLSKSGH